MSIFGIVLMSYIIYQIIIVYSINELFKKMISITLIVGLAVRMGYFAKIGDLEITYTMFLYYITTILAIGILLKRGIERKSLKALFILLIAFILNIVCFYFFRYTEPVIQSDWTNYVLGSINYSYINDNALAYGHYILFLCVLIIFAAFLRVYTEKEISRLVSSVSKFCKGMIILGYVEFFIKNIWHSNIITSLCIFLFGASGAQQNLVEQRGLFYTIQGATKEPSMYVTKLFYICLIFLLLLGQSKRKEKKYALGWIIATIILLIFDSTMSSLVYIVIILIILISQKRSIKSEKGLRDYRKIIIPISAIVFLSFLSFYIINNYKILLGSDNYFLNRIGVAGQQLSIMLNGSMKNLKYSSEAIRFSGIVYDFKLFIKRPLFGVGMGVVVCNSGIISMLCNIGIVGFIAWFYSITSFYIRKELKTRCIIYAFLIAILPNVILNDYETLQNLAIPIVAYIYYLLENKTMYENTYLRNDLLNNTYE